VKAEIKTIQDELSGVRDHISRLERSLEDIPDYGLGEGDPAIVRSELDRALLQRERERAASLEEALSRLEQGTYGVCEQCGSPIHPDRMAILPDARVCVQCARSGPA
jgi:RNA polymerase-binding transcription factor DksA